MWVMSVGWACAGTRKKSWFPPFIQAVLQIIELGCLGLLTHCCEAIQNSLKMPVASPWGILKDLIFVLSLRKSASWFQEMNLLDQSITRSVFFAEVVQSDLIVISWCGSAGRGEEQGWQRACGLSQGLVLLSWGRELIADFLLATRWQPYPEHQGLSYHY